MGIPALNPVPAGDGSASDQPQPGARAALALLLVRRALVGVGEGPYGPVAPDMISDMYPARRRGAVLAWFYVAAPVGGALGYALGALCVRHLSWHWAFYLMVPPGVLLAVLCW